MLLQIHPKNPPPRLIKQIVESLQQGGVIIYPTDTVYGLGCDILQQKAVERICRIKKVEPRKAQLSFVCSDLSHLSEYAKPISNPVYRLLKDHLPGPYTFILPASKMVPKILQSKKDTIGLRIPDNNIAMAIINELAVPFSALRCPGNGEDYTDPEVMYEISGMKWIMWSMVSGNDSSTIVDFTGSEPILIRQGLGEWED
jgi:tRNA threonylcarbamoyl adenosine modification protein (Sua5/YciO/YrdC/YwlC family)